MSNVVAILFSGQGGQHRDMFRMLDRIPEAVAVFEAAAPLLGSDPRDFVRDADEAALFTNRAGQILCCTQALAAWAMLGDARPARTVLAGYSVGELASWGCAGFFEPAQVLALAAARADAMDHAAPAEAGLAAIVGLRLSALEQVMRGRDVQIAIVNGVDSFVIGGTGEALTACLLDAKLKGAARIVRLRVSVPSHTMLLKQASTSFGEILDTQAIHAINPGVRLLSGIDGETVRDPHQGLHKLALQISQTVAWSTCLEACQEAGASVFLEMGPGGALTKMAEALPDRPMARCLEQFHSAAGIHDWLRNAV